MPTITNHPINLSHQVQAGHANTLSSTAAAPSTTATAETAADQRRHMEKHNYIPPTLTLGDRTIRVGAMLGAIPREDRQHFAQVMHNIVHIASEPSPTTPENELPAHEGQPGMDAEGNITPSNQKIQSYVGRYLTPDGHVANALVTVHTDAKDNLLGIATSDVVPGIAPSDVGTHQAMKMARFKPPVALDQAGLIAKYGQRFRQAVANPIQHKMLIQGYKWGKEKGAPNLYDLKQHEAETLHQFLFDQSKSLLPYERSFLAQVKEALEDIDPNLKSKLLDEDKSGLDDVMHRTSYFHSFKNRAFLQHLLLKYGPPLDSNHLSESHLNRLYDMLIGARIELTAEEEKFADKIEGKLSAGEEFDRAFADPSDLKFAFKLLSKYQTVPSMKAVSEENLKSVRSRLTAEKPLQAHEKAFLQRLESTPFFITHATPSNTKDSINQADGSVVLFSREKLLEKKVAFNKTNTEERDIDAIGSDDNVFFSLECGETPQKPMSRFGDRLMRFPITHPAVQATGTLSLSDPLSTSAGSSEMLRRLLEKLQHHPDMDAIIEKFDRRQNVHAGETVFHGEHMLSGLGLSIIQACREYLPDDLAKNLLEKSDLNDVVNSLFRPLIMVPRHFTAVPHDEKQIAFEPYS